MLSHFLPVTPQMFVSTCRDSSSNLWRYVVNSAWSHSHRSETNLYVISCLGYRQRRSNIHMLIVTRIQLLILPCCLKMIKTLMLNIRTVISSSFFSSKANSLAAAEFNCCTSRMKSRKNAKWSVHSRIIPCQQKKV